MTKGPLAVFICLLMPSVAFGATVILRTGQQVEGNILEHTAKFVRIYSPAGGTMTFYKDEIQDIEDKRPEPVPPQPQAASVSPQDVNPVQVLAKVRQKYQSLQTLKARGTMTDKVKGRKFVIPFVLMLEKPNKYLISWQNPRVTGDDIVGALWSEGDQPYIYQRTTNSYSKLNGDRDALTQAKIVSYGAAYTLPVIFFSDNSIVSSPLDKITKPVLQGVDTAGDEDCFVLTGPPEISKKGVATQEWYWVSKSTYLIRQYESSTRPLHPKRGQKPGLHIEKYSDISSDIGGQAFQFALPKGASLGDYRRQVANPDS